MPRHVIKGDTVMVTSGEYKGQVGEVLRVIPKHDEVVVRGVNVKTKHVKASRTNPQGSVITIELPIPACKVSPVVDGKPARVGFRTETSGRKVRVARRGGSEVKVLSEVRKA
jgi:large subunit ribosomal protein L24